MLYPTGSDPQRLPKGGSHFVESVDAPKDKPGFVKPGGGRNKDMGSMEAMPGFEGLNSYKSECSDSRTDYGQDVTPPANKSSGPSIGK